MPFCAFCGGGTDFVRSYIDRGRARVDFRCAVGCRTTTQHIYCDEDPRRLLMIWRTSPVYTALRGSHFTYERKHSDLRTQYLVAPKTLDIRPKRMGIAWQQLRANAAMLIDWVRVTIKMGWQDGTGARATTVAVTSGASVGAGIARRRRRLGRTGGGTATHGPPRIAA